MSQKCSCKTIKGKQCLRQAVKNSEYCWQHTECKRPIKKSLEKTKTKSVTKKSLEKIKTKSVIKKSSEKKAKKIKKTELSQEKLDDFIYNYLDEYFDELLKEKDIVHVYIPRNHGKYMSVGKIIKEENRTEYYLRLSHESKEFPGTFVMSSSFTKVSKEEFLLYCFTEYNKKLGSIFVMRDNKKTGKYGREHIKDNLNKAVTKFKKSEKNKK